MEGDFKMNGIMEYLKSCGTFYLATSDAGQAHVRPFGAVCTKEHGVESKAMSKKTYAEKLEPL